jgi:hypothetical protein
MFCGCLEEGVDDPVYNPDTSNDTCGDDKSAKVRLNLIPLPQPCITNYVLVRVGGKVDGAGNACSPQLDGENYQETYACCGEKDEVKNSHEGILSTMERKGRTVAG